MQLSQDVPSVATGNMDYYKILGYYPSKSGFKSVANMPTGRRMSQPDILETSDNSSFYSSNYSSSNYSAIYSSGPTKDTPETEANKLPTTKNYSMVPRMGRRASKEITAKYVKRDNSRPEHKDYQDIYKDRKSAVKTTQSEIQRRISIDTGAIITSVPSIPSRKYKREDDYSTYDELAEGTAPPKITPISGLLNQNAGKAVVRPIAFKPVVTSKMSSSFGIHSPESCGYEKPHIDDGYSSQESRACSHNGTMKDDYIYEARRGSYGSGNYRDQKSTECYRVTPSPTNNSNYEQLIQEKERELSSLRLTMEENEKAIFQVNDEKRHNWEGQMKELTSEYHRRLRLQQDRAHKSEQELQDQINKLEKDNQRMLQESEQLTQSRASHTQEQLKSLRAKNEELSNRLTDMKCECETLRKQDEEKQNQIQTLEELVTVIKAENMNLSNELDEKRRKNKKQEKATPNGEDREVEQLKKVLSERDAALQAERQQYLHDRELWEQEKKKVLQYQRQLQSNYIQMCRRNTELESRFQQPYRSQNNNNQVEKTLPASYPSKAQDKCAFKAQLDNTPESLC